MSFIAILARGKRQTDRQTDRGSEVQGKWWVKLVNTSVNCGSCPQNHHRKNCVQYVWPHYLVDKMNCRKTQIEVFNVMGALYAGTMLLGVQNASTVQPVVAVERTVFYRERAASMYSPLPYALAQVREFHITCFSPGTLFITKLHNSNILQLMYPQSSPQLHSPVLSGSYFCPLICLKKSFWLLPKIQLLLSTHLPEEKEKTHSRAMNLYLHWRWLTTTG